MISNFHTHTSLCQHAEGMPDDYVAAAQLSGCSILGFSDHCPYPKDGRNTWADVRMAPEESDRYIAAIRAAGEHSAFPVYAGFECEYDRCYVNWYRDELKGRLGADYLVFGPHWVAAGNEMLYAPELSTQEEVHRYFDGVIEGIQSGLFAFVAHPDLIMASGRCWDRELQACFEAVIDAAVSCRVPLEINGLGLARRMVPGEHGLRHPYPVDEFWQIVVRKGAAVICNADAHRPGDVIKNAQLARDYASRFGIIPVETVF